MNCEKCGECLWDYNPTKLNEEGWSCVNCGFVPGEPPGFCPQLDMEELPQKIEAILLFLTGDTGPSRLVHVSNSSHGESIICSVYEWCCNSGRRDAKSIIHVIFDDCGHSEYWAKIRDGVLSGNDVRDRCRCGALSTCTRMAKGKTEHICNTCEFTT